MKFQSIALMIQHTFKSLKIIKSPTACFTISIIRGKLPENNKYSDKRFLKYQRVSLFGSSRNINSIISLQYMQKIMLLLVRNRWDIKSDILSIYYVTK